MRLWVSVNNYRGNIKHPNLYAVNQHNDRMRDGKRLGALCLPNTERNNLGSKVMKKVFTVNELKEKLAQVGLPFDEVESGAEGVVLLAFGTDDPDYNEERD